MNQEREMFCGMGAFQHKIFGFGCGSTLSFKTVLFGNFFHHPEIESLWLWNGSGATDLPPRDHVNMLASSKSQRRELHAQGLSPISLPECLPPQSLNPPHLSSTSKKPCGEERGRERKMLKFSGPTFPTLHPLPTSFHHRDTECCFVCWCPLPQGNTPNLQTHRQNFPMGFLTPSVTGQQETSVEGVGQRIYMELRGQNQAIEG